MMGVVTLIIESQGLHYEDYFFIQSDLAIACQENRRFFLLLKFLKIF